MFGKFFSKAKAHANSFFGSTLPNAARSGHRFLNDVIVPGAKKAHRVITVASEEVGKNDISAKNAKRLQDVSRFADAGLSRVNALNQTVNNVASRLAANS